MFTMKTSEAMSLYMHEAASYMDRLLIPLLEHLVSLSMVVNVQGCEVERAYRAAKDYQPPVDYGDWRNHFEWVRSLGRPIVEAIVETDEWMSDHIEVDKAAEFASWLCDNFRGRVNVSWLGNDTLRLEREDGESVSVRIK